MEAEASFLVFKNMKRIHYKIIALSALLVLSGIFGVTRVHAEQNVQPLTSEEVALLRSLLQRFANYNNGQTLTTTNADPSTSSTKPCHQFAVDLGYGDGGGTSLATLDKESEVRALQDALEYLGFSVNRAEKLAGSVFQESTAAAVVKFQAKYGITQTGFVGPRTRALLNKLISCDSSSGVRAANTSNGAISEGASVAQKPVSRIYDVIVPTGIPATLIKGETYKIIWSAQNIEKPAYGVTLHSQTGDTLAVIANPDYTEKSVSWKVPTTMSDLANAYIEVVSNGISAKSAPFRVTSYVDTLASVTVVSPNGGTGSELEQGATFNIYWRASNDGLVDLTLKNVETGKVDVIATEIRGNKGGNSFTYKISDGQPLGKYKVVIKAQLGASDESDSPFSIVSPKPKIISLTPRSVYVGDTVTIKGNGFLGATADTIFIADQKGSIGPKSLTSVTANMITFVVPNIPVGPYRVSLLSDSGATNVVDLDVLGLTANTGLEVFSTQFQNTVISFNYPSTWKAADYDYATAGGVSGVVGFRVAKKDSSGVVVGEIVWGGPQSAGDSCDRLVSIKVAEPGYCASVTGAGITAPFYLAYGAKAPDASEVYKTIQKTLSVLSTK